MILVKYLEQLDKWHTKISSDNHWSHMQLVKQIEENLALTFLHEKSLLEGDEGLLGNICFANSPEVRDDYKLTFTPSDLFDYMYAILHSPGYSERYRGALKIDFLRIPPPKDPISFWQLIHLGGELRQLHLLENMKFETSLASFPKKGSSEIKTTIGRNDWKAPPSDPSREVPIGRIWINDDQYFDNIPLVAWEYHIAGYRPAQKWLIDRRGRILTIEDIAHYKKIIFTLTETHHLMLKIGTVKIGK